MSPSLVGSPALRRALLAVVTILIAATIATPTLALSGGARVRLIDSAPAGYLGCHEGVGAARYDHYSCLVAYREGENVKIVFQGRAATLPSGLVRTYVEEATVPADAIRVLTSSSKSIPGVEVEADLPRTGHILIRAWSFSGFYKATGIDGGCGIGLSFTLHSTPRDYVVGYDSDVTGTVNGVEIQDTYDRCGTYFWGPTTGVFKMLTPTEETLLP